jgi:hypothetical protein
MTKQSPMLSIYDGQKCCGWIIERAKGYEAYDVAEHSLGIFAKRELAIEAACDPPDKQREAPSGRDIRRGLENGSLGSETDANVARPSRQVKRGDVCDGV